MILQAHLSYPFLAMFALDKALSLNLDQSHYLLLFFFSVFPDFDIPAYSMMKRRFQSDVRHHQWLTHWPVTYLPLLILFVLKPSLKLGVVVFALYFHLFLDIFNTGDGIMLAYPFSKKSFLYFSKTTKGLHGLEWLRVYKKTRKYKADIIAFGAAIALFYASFVR